MIIFFTIFAFLLLISAAGVVSFKNPIYAVLSLMFAFINVAGLFILIGVEFLSLSLVIVYVGAVAVLFLFVVMMLNTKLASLKEDNHSIFIPLSITVVILFVVSLLLITSVGINNYSPNNVFVVEKQLTAVTNTQMIGEVMYTEFFIPFQLAGILLLIAMIGAIVLAHRSNPSPKRQDINIQLRRTKEDSIRLVDLPRSKE